MRRARIPVALLAMLPALLAGALGATSSPAAAATCAGDPTITVAASVKLGGTLHLSGSGWCLSDGSGGSRLALKFDGGGAINRVDTPVVAGKPDVWALVDAADDGSIDADVQMPDGTTATSSPALATGSHTFTILTGSLKTGDQARNVTTPSFEVLPADTPDDDPSTWGTPLSAGTAKAWVQRSVTTTGADGGTLRVAGTGWLASGGGPSTIAVKLNASESTQFERATDIQQSDPTIWALFTAESDGSFDRELELPAGLAAGDYLAVRLASGKFGAGDVQRSLVSPLIAIDGTTWTQPDEDADVTCAPASSAVTATVATHTVPLGGTVVVRGTGWCNANAGGSVIGVKIDDGAYSHLDDKVHTNRTIWAIVRADAATGSFTASIELPDGTTATSTPALTNGAHTLRFLSGSLKSGDPIRSLSADFVVGTYQPNGSPDPLAASALTASSRHGVTATRLNAHRLRVVVPGSPAGTWVFLSAYVGDGSPRYPWSDRWVRLDSRHGVTVAIPRKAPTGTLRVVVQSGEEGEVGRLLGWVRTTLRPAVLAPTSATGSATAVSLPVATLVVPARPASSYAALGRLSQHSAAATQDGAVVTLTFPEAAPAQALFLTVYAEGRVIPAGWVTVDDERRVRVDLAALGDASFRIAAQAQDGALAGWVPVRIGNASDADADSEAAETQGDAAATAGAATAAPVESRIRDAADAPFVSDLDGWLLGLGALVLAGTATTLGAARLMRGAA
ncbi:MAG: hypothetical protein QM572_17190 [Nocardioides sp.]|uniref:hypothetical protein n=1 Tax=Nocardioides sp. TaxID=35761 RepID=UPI0039E56B93